VGDRYETADFTSFRACFCGFRVRGFDMPNADAFEKPVAWRTGKITNGRPMLLPDLKRWSVLCKRWILRVFYPRLHV